MDQALCKGLHSDFWFPPVFSEERTAPESQYYEIAKLVCEQCPVEDRCRKLGADEEWGVWGGTSPKDRKAQQVVRPKKVLPYYKIKHAIPAANSCPAVDIPAVKLALKQYTERRPR
jgi:hypothetical protein